VEFYRVGISACFSGGCSGNPNKQGEAYLVPVGNEFDTNNHIRATRVLCGGAVIIEYDGKRFFRQLGGYYLLVGAFMGKWTIGKAKGDAKEDIKDAQFNRREIIWANIELPKEWPITPDDLVLQYY
jgi:hypothetical protein